MRFETRCHDSRSEKGAALGHLTTQKSFYVEISRARDRAEFVTDDKAALREQLEGVTGERISALEGIGEAVRETPGKAAAVEKTGERAPEGGLESGAGSKDKDRDMPGPERERSAGMDLGL